MPKKPKPTNDEFSHLHLEIETPVLNALRTKYPGYGELSRIVRSLLRAFLRKDSNA